MTESDLLAEAGRALFPARGWQTALAEALGVGPRRVRAWLLGEEPIPAGIWRDLPELAHLHRVELDKLEALLAARARRLAAR